MLTKEKSSQKRKGVNNQNNSPFLYELFPVVNTIASSSSLLSNLVLYLSFQRDVYSYFSEIKNRCIASLVNNPKTV